jgi:predicted kinase
LPDLEECLGLVLYSDYCKGTAMERQSTRKVQAGTGARFARPDVGSEPKLILFSGPPGCGKTTLAQRVAASFRFPLLAKDRIQQVLREAVPKATGMDGYRLMLALADEQLALGVSVILDAVFPLGPFRDEAREIAARHGARWKPVVCHCSDRSVWQGRMDNRVQYVPHWTPVGWDEVERVLTYYSPWSKGEALFLDSVEPVVSNFARLVKYLEE